MDNEHEFDDTLSDFDYEGALTALDEADALSASEMLHKLPMFQALFNQSVGDDLVLASFAEHVAGELSDRFALKAAKGGAFFRAREQEGLSHAYRFEYDQNLRAHLINGMLPALHVARQLHVWGADLFEDWNETYERIFISGYILHDFTKIEAVKQRLRDNGFKDWDAPDKEQMPVLERIFGEWCVNLGLDNFLETIGGFEQYTNELIYIACNTQRMKGTARAPFLYGHRVLESDARDLITELSRFADLTAYVARTPRDFVANESIRKLIAQELTSQFDEHRPIARFMYHHVAENRGLLLNFIHNGVIEAIAAETRIPLLYAPGGVVYLERHDAPALPDIDDVVATVVSQIRTNAGEELINTGKGAKRGNTFLQIDDSYNDFFTLPDMVLGSMKLIRRYIYSNKTPNRFEKMRAYRWTGRDNIPESTPTDPQDARADQIAEWAGFVETQFRDRYDPDTRKIVQWLLDELGIRDLEADFMQLKSEATRGGLRYWWHWAAVHVLDRQPPMDDVAVQEWLFQLSQKLVSELPGDLPESANINQETWYDLADYIKGVLTISGIKSQSVDEASELEQYVQAKVKRGVSACAMCGSDYPTRRPKETAVAFQPGVYTGRIGIGASNNKRNLCSICATEQLLRQLFLQNLDTGSKAESQRIRYLSFYPSYFFSPATLKVVQGAYQRIKAIRLSDNDFWRILREQDDLQDVTFWQGLDNFLLRQKGEVDESKFKKVLRYHENAQSTFFTVGFRNLDPTETESWVMPTLLAFVMAINLDVKVVVSDSGVPLMLESSELPETLWFDGLHPGIQQLISVKYDLKKAEKLLPADNPLKAYKLEPNTRPNVDDMSLALARLTAAYLIHLDTEYAPPKENWQRFTPIANALCESPLYVFHYLKKQERDDRPLTRNKIKRYLYYAELFNIQGDENMTHASELVRLYRGFYRAKTIKNANSILRPLSVVSDAILVADRSVFDSSEALYEIAYGELSRFMDRVGTGQADGRFPKGISVTERQSAMRDFARYFINNVFDKGFNSDVAALRGKQLNLLKSACEVLYRDAQYAEWDANEELESADIEQ